MPHVRFFFTLIALFFFSLQAPVASAEKVVRVAGYTFPPFVNHDGSKGLTVDFLELLNSQQTEYRFIFSKIPSNRRYWAIEHQSADMILFEMSEWGWQDYQFLYQESRDIFHGGEVYITRAEQGRDQSYFEDIKSKHIAGVFGYHYGFADFNGDRKWLEDNFEIHLIDNPSHVITMILRNRADVGVVTESFLNLHFAKYPQAMEELLVSKKKDQEYRLKALAGNHSPLSLADFHALLDSLKENGELKKFFDLNGVGEHFPE